MSDGSEFAMLLGIIVAFMIMHSCQEIKIRELQKVHKIPKTCESVEKCGKHD